MAVQVRRHPVPEEGPAISIGIENTRAPSIQSDRRGRVRQPENIGPSASRPGCLAAAVAGGQAEAGQAAGEQARRLGHRDGDRVVEAQVVEREAEGWLRNSIRTRLMPAAAIVTGKRATPETFCVAISNPLASKAWITKTSVSPPMSPTVNETRSVMPGADPPPVDEAEVDVVAVGQGDAPGGSEPDDGVDAGTRRQRSVGDGDAGTRLRRGRRRPLARRTGR